MDPFNKLTLYGLLARRWALEEFIKEQMGLIEFITKHIRSSDDAQRMIDFIKSLDLNDSDYNYAINLVSVAVSIKVKSAQDALEKPDE
jgi:hypothetical protein